MARVIGLKLEAALNRPGPDVYRLDRYSDYANLTRLYDFLEIKVTGRTSARGRAFCDRSNRQQIVIKIFVARARNCFDEAGRSKQA